MRFILLVTQNACSASQSVYKVPNAGPVQANLLFQTRLATTNQITALSLKIRPGAIEFP
jgi:hypothetical protein